MKSFINFSLGLLFILSTYTITAQESTTTIYLIRHAEKVKVDPTDKNPHLNEKGVKRTHAWADFFTDIELDEIYSTPYHRTRETVALLAKVKNIDIQTYEPHNRAVDSIVKARTGKSILFVGHSNTIPKHVNHLIGEDRYADMSEHDNHSLFIVQQSAEHSTVVRIFVD